MTDHSNKTSTELKVELAAIASQFEFLGYAVSLQMERPQGRSREEIKFEASRSVKPQEAM
jgi:hypothetical protein